MLLIVAAVLRPFREVHFSSSEIDVVDNEPGDGSDVAVPGPARLVGMTIVARSIEDRGRGRGNLQLSLDRSRFFNLRIGTRWTDKLECDENDGQGNRRPFQNLSHQTRFHAAHLRAILA